MVAQRHTISEFSEYIRSRMGLLYPENRWGELEKRLAMAAKELQFRDAEACIDWVLSSPSDRRTLDVLASFLTIGETYFYREGKSLNALIERVFPEIMRDHEYGNHTISIWSAGCCTGEEPYTIAMMVASSILFKGWSVKIIATDINQNFLEKARIGVYSDWSFRGMDTRIRDKYFTKIDKSKYEILPAIKQMVDFSYLNLIEDPYPGLKMHESALDLILCRNVLMYFAPEYSRSVIKKFNLALDPDGWLLVSPVEVALVDTMEFSHIFHGGAVLNRKVQKKQNLFEEPMLRMKLQSRKSIAKVEPKIESAPVMKQYNDLYDIVVDKADVSFLETKAGKVDAGISDFLLLSKTYADKGLLWEAENWSLRAIGSNRTSAECQYLLALIKIEQNLFNEAIKILRKVIFLAPDFIIAHFMLATLYRNKQKIERSGLYFKNALGILKTLGVDEDVPDSGGVKVSDFMDLIATIRADGRTHGHSRANFCN